MKKTLLFLLSALLVAGCGYRMAGFGSDINKFYIDSIVNDSFDYTIDRDMEQYVTRFFLNFGMLGDYEESEYVMRVRLVEKSETVAIYSDTRQASRSTLGVSYEIHVENKNGRQIYHRNIRRTRTFSVGDDIRSYTKAVQDTFNELTDTILTEFRYDFRPAS